jgi:hypothetical protein
LKKIPILISQNWKGKKKKKRAITHVLLFEI